MSISPPSDLIATSAAGLSSRPSGADFPAPQPTLAAALERSARDHPDHGVHYLAPDGTVREQTYPELLSEAARILTGLRALGLRPGDPVIFQLELAEDFIPAFWACTLGGFVPAPVSIAPTYEQGHSALAKLTNAWTMLGQPLLLAGTALAPRLRAYGERDHLPGLRIAVVDELRRSQPASTWHPAAAEDLALLLLTSGSTGVPKAVRQTQGNLLAWAASVASACEFTAAEVSLNWMPLDHVGGLVMFHLRDAVLGCRQWHAPTEVILQNPLTWLDWIERHRVTITWAPNFAFGLVNDHAAEMAGRTWDLASLRFILNGGEAIVPKTARRFLQLLAPHGLPATAMRPAWGMSETCSGVTYSRRFTLATTHDNDGFAGVGEPIPGVEIRIVGPDDRPLAEGKTGRLQIRGISVTPGYYHNPEANRDAFTADGWFITGDLGVVKDRQLSITGREKDVIIINGLNYYSHEIESVVEEVKGVEVSFTAACAIRAAGENTDQVAIFFSPAVPEMEVPALIRAIRTRVGKIAGLNPDYVVPLAKAAVPKTSIGKIQRSQLKQQFERGDYADRAQGDPGAPADRTAVPDWFYRPAWREAPPHASDVAAGAALIFADAAGLGEALASALSLRGGPCLRVEPGAGFSQQGTAAFSIAPDHPEDYDRLLAAVGPLPAYVVYLWGYGAPPEPPASVTALEERLAREAQGLLCLVQALAKLELAGTPVRLLVVTSAARAVQAGDPIAYTRAPLLGLTRTIPHELSGLECRHIDLDLGDAAAGALHLQAEMSEAEHAPESAWRGARRFVPFLEKIPLQPGGASPLKQHGRYLLSGGLGGVGQHVAAYLAQHFQARLLIVGRSPLPPPAQWAAAATTPTPAGEMARACLQIEAAGGEIEYQAADVADLDALEAAVGRAERAWGQPLDGVFHLAGLYRENVLAQEAPAAFAATLRPKAAGAWALHEIARHRPGCLFVHFSSLISQFGSLSTGAYSAANNFLDAFAHYQRRSGGVRSFNILWSSWTDTGMSRDGGAARDALTSRGYLTVSPAHGVASLAQALRRDEPQLVIGIDPAHPAIRKHLHPEVAAKSAPAAEAGAAAGGANGRVAPRNETERQLAAVWEELLGVPRIGVTDNFFELGGRSLLAAKMFARLHKAFGKNLPIPVLFKAPTIEQLAVALLEHPKSPAMRIRLLHPGSNRPALILLLEPGAEPASAEPLTRHLPPDVPQIAVQPRVPTPPAPVVLDRTADLLADEIAALAPSGPLTLAGVGFGSLLAWAAAARLEARGRIVGRVLLLAPPPAAFFALTGAGAAARARLTRPAAPASGMFGRLFKKEAPADSGVTKELLAERDHFAEGELGSLAGPVAIFTAHPGPEPWRALARGTFAVHPLTELERGLGALLPA